MRTTFLEAELVPIRVSALNMIATVHILIKNMASTLTKAFWSAQSNSTFDTLIKALGFYVCMYEYMYKIVQQLTWLYTTNNH